MDSLAFCLDERFIMKQMSKAEMQSFLEFGPHYFDYVTKSLSDKQAKVGTRSLIRRISNTVSLIGIA